MIIITWLLIISNYFWKYHVQLLHHNCLLLTYWTLFLLAPKLPFPVFLGFSVVMFTSRVPSGQHAQDRGRTLCCSHVLTSRFFLPLRPYVVENSRDPLVLSTGRFTSILYEIKAASLAESQRWVGGELSWNIIHCTHFSLLSILFYFCCGNYQVLSIMILALIIKGLTPKF